MEDTGAARRGRAARLPRAGWRREGGAGRAAGRRRGCGGRCDGLQAGDAGRSCGGRRDGLQASDAGRGCGGPAPALLHGPTSLSKNQALMKSDRVYVVLPKHFKHGKSTLLWALRNVAKNGERLFIVHVHRHKHISPKALEKIGEYVSMCKEWKVSCASCPLQITKNDDVAKELAELIDRHGITKLVMRGAAGKHYSK